MGKLHLDKNGRMWESVKLWERNRVRNTRTDEPRRVTRKLPTGVCWCKPLSGIELCTLGMAPHTFKTLGGLMLRNTLLGEEGKQRAGGLGGQSYNEPRTRLHAEASERTSIGTNQGTRFASLGKGVNSGFLRETETRGALYSRSLLADALLFSPFRGTCATTPNSPK